MYKSAEKGRATYLVLGVERNHGGFMCSNNNLASSDHTFVGFGGQLVGEQKQDEAALQQIPVSYTHLTLPTKRIV